MESGRPILFSRTLVFIQFLLGVGAHLLLAVPYLRRVHGVGRLDPAQRYLFVSNHVSLLDTILLGALCWRAGCYPILVLGDKSVWHAGWIRRALSSKIGFLLDRGRLNPGRIRELQSFAQASAHFHLIVFPEGTRGDGVNIAPCQPGLFHIAQEARVPIVPIHLENMERVSTKAGRFHPISGLRQVEVHFGEPIPPDRYLGLERDPFTEFIRRSLSSARPSPRAAHLSPALPRAAAPRG